MVVEKFLSLYTTVWSQVKQIEHKTRYRFKVRFAVFILDSLSVYVSSSLTLTVDSVALCSSNSAVI